MVLSPWRALLPLAVAGMLGNTALAGSIEEPRDGEVIHTNSGDVTVVVSGVEPEQRVQAVIDGRSGDAVTPPTLQLHGIERGDHTLVVRVLDENSREVDRTAPVTFHVWHASRLMPRGP